MTKGHKSNSNSSPNSNSNSTSPSKRSKIEPNPNTQTASTKKEPPCVDYVCVICNTDVHESNRQEHFDGRKHRQLQGFLSAVQQTCDNLEKLPSKKPENVAVILDTEKLKGPGGWRCEACEESLSKAVDVKRHQGLREHQGKIRKAWESYKENVHFVGGLRKGQFPKDKWMAFFPKSKRGGVKKE